MILCTDGTRLSVKIRDERARTRDHIAQMAVEVKLHAFLSSALGGVEYLLHDPTKFYLRDMLTVSVRQLSGP